MKIMRKVPGGTLLVPMIVSSILHTFYPNLFRIGGMTEAVFSGNTLTYILGLSIFLSGCGLDLSIIRKVARRYGILLIVKVLLSVVLGYGFVSLFGMNGTLGISAIAFIVVITSANPTLFLALMQDFGDDVDVSAFGFVSLLATPAIPMFIYGLTGQGSVDVLSIVSILIPLVIGVVLGNLDKELGKFLAGGMPLVIVLLGWSIGIGLNLKEALLAGVSGLIATVLYYIFNLPIMLGVEKAVLKRSGVSAAGICTIAGVSASVPMVIAQTTPAVAIYAPKAAAIVTFGVIFSSILSPIIVKHLYQKGQGK